jgi:signal transduction histidine kinase
MEICKSVSIMTSSSSLLLLNVEDILGFAQLKAGKFVKVIKGFNIKRAVEEIVAIQQYQAESKNISIRTEFIGFPLKSTGKATSYYDKDLKSDSCNLVI